MRLACVHVPQLTLAAALRRNPGAHDNFGGAALVAAQGKQKRIIFELDAAARRAGVRPGMTAAQASAVCPGLRLYTATDADREAGAAALADVGFAFAPRVEQEFAWVPTGFARRDPSRGAWDPLRVPNSESHVFFDASDLGRLYPYGEQALAQAIAATAERLGLAARVAIAPSKGMARLAAGAHALAVVPNDRAGARAFVAPLPVELLTPNQDLRAAFRRWGTRTAGAIAALPVDAVGLRLGPAGAAVARLARGEDDEPFVPLPPPDALEEAVELDYPVHEIEPLAFVVRGLIDRVLARLTARSLACAGLTLRLTLDPRGLDVRTVPIAAPTREGKTLLELTRLDISRRPPAAAVVGVHLIALPARVRATQLDILRPAGPAPDRLATTLARLSALVGPENVGAPASVDTWREEAIAMVDYRGDPERVPTPPRDGLRWAEPSSVHAITEPVARLSIRRRRPPEEIEVLMGRDGPTALHGKETTARVLIAAGPYRLSGEWWRDDSGPDREGAGWAREYWDVHASDGAVYRLHRDARSGRFYLDGYYD